MAADAPKPNHNAPANDKSGPEAAAKTASRNFIQQIIDADIAAGK